VVSVVGRKSHVLTEVERREKRQKLESEDCEVICGIIMMNIKVAGDDEFMRRGSSKTKEKMKSSRKIDKGWMRKEGVSCCCQSVCVSKV